MIKYSKYKHFYSELEWNILIYRINKIHSYYVKHKEVISKSKYTKYSVFEEQSHSYFE